MEALFIVVNHEEHFHEILNKFSASGIHGGTIFDTEGLAATQAASEDSSQLGLDYLKLFLNDGRPYNKTILLLLTKEEVETAKSCVREVIGDLQKENVGIMFSFEVSSFEGLTK